MSDRCDRGVQSHVLIPRMSAMVDWWWIHEIFYYARHIIHFVGGFGWFWWREFFYFRGSIYESTINLSILMGMCWWNCCPFRHFSLTSPAEVRKEAWLGSAWGLFFSLRPKNGELQRNGSVCRENEWRWWMMMITPWILRFFVQSFPRSERAHGPILGWIPNGFPATVQLGTMDQCRSSKLNDSWWSSPTGAPVFFGDGFNFKTLPALSLLWFISHIIDVFFSHIHSTSFLMVILSILNHENKALLALCSEDED